MEIKSTILLFLLFVVNPLELTVLAFVTVRKSLMPPIPAAVNPQILTAQANALETEPTTTQLYPGAAINGRETVWEFVMEPELMIL